MTSLSDAAVRHLRAVADVPDLTETRYEMVRPLGRGGMGTVHLVNDTQLERLEHPGIVPVHDVGVLPDGRTYYAMKFVRGDRLDVLLAKPLSVFASFKSSSGSARRWRSRMPRA